MARTLPQALSIIHVEIDKIRIGHFKSNACCSCYILALSIDQLKPIFHFMYISAEIRYHSLVLSDKT
jgi:hypothetical protein